MATSKWLLAFLGVILGSCCALDSVPAAEAEWRPPHATTPAERAIIRSLYTRYPGPVDVAPSEVRAEFLRKVLSAPLDPATQSPPFVHVTKAIFKERLVLDGLRSIAYLSFDGCSFAGDVDITDSTLKSLEISGPLSVTLTIETSTVAGALSLVGVTLGKPLNVKNSYFGKEIYFNDVALAGDGRMLFDAVRAPQGIRGVFLSRADLTVQASEDVNGLSVIARRAGSKVFVNRMKHGNVFVGVDPGSVEISFNGSSLDELTIWLTDGGKVDDGIEWADPLATGSHGGSIAIWNSDVGTTQIVQPALSYFTVSDSKFSKAVELRGPLPDTARFTQVDFKNLTFAGASKSNKFVPMVWQNVDFQSLISQDGPTGHALTPSEILEAVAFNPDVYSAYERYRTSVGDKQGADDLFMARKRRQRSADPNVMSQIGSYLSEWLIGYGRQPERSLVAIVAFIGIGAFVFNERHMKSTKSSPTKLASGPWRHRPAKPEPEYSALWYSLDTLVPIINFGVAASWEPTDERRRGYLKLHIAAGWLLATFAVAAVSGLVK